MKTLSVIIPFYNAEDYLQCCLESIPFRAFEGNLEVILVNDGSTDASCEICEQFCRVHPDIILINQKNRGLSEARNAGIKIANGYWIYFLDADDRVTPHALQTMLNYAQEQQCDMVIGAWYYAYKNYLLYDDRWFKGRNPFILNREEAMQELLLQHYFKNFAWGKLYRTQIAKMHLFRPGVFFEDVYWQHLMVHEIHRMGVIPEPLYYYRQRKDSISGSFSIRNLDLLKGADERLSFIKMYYKRLAPLANKQFILLVQSFLESALHSQQQDIIDTFVSFAQEHHISRKNWFERNLLSAWARLTGKRPTIIPIQ